jgi:hypothetical protein
MDRDRDRRDNLENPPANHVTNEQAGSARQTCVGRLPGPPPIFLLPDADVFDALHCTARSLAPPTRPADVFEGNVTP